MQVQSLTIPKLSNNIEVSVFDADSYLVKHTQLDYRLKISHSTMQMLNLVDGHRVCSITERILLNIYHNFFRCF